MFKEKMLQPTLKNLTRPDFGKPPKKQNEVIIFIKFCLRHVIFLGYKIYFKYFRLCKDLENLMSGVLTIL